VRAVFNGADMTHMTGRNARIGFVTLMAAILTVGIGGDAFAMILKAHRHAHARSVAYASRAQLVSEQPVRLGPMRYYGGPKSPMWRGPAEN
jgi:hypothetical protein